ncbi:hypothetical protein P8452_58317 [Trifolium repens]|nr:hypothetical protein P8452_58317 [Trifolium repens]
MAGHLLLIMFLLSLTPPFIVHSRNNLLGFISIDCGLVDKPSYTDETTTPFLFHKEGTPFISVLELRVLNSDSYLVNSLELLGRFDVGLQGSQKVR